MILLFVIVAHGLSFAQLRVNSSGNVEVGDNYFYSFYSGKLWSKCKSLNDSMNGALCGIVQLDSATTLSTAGVYGLSNGYGGNKSYGVAGILTGTGNGAGIYGTDFVLCNNVSGRYAGYFRGDVNVSNTLSAMSVVTTSDNRLKENISTLNTSLVQGSTLQNLMGMNVIQYNFKTSHKLEELEQESKGKEIPEETISAEKKKLEAIHSQKHYGLSAQELQKIYPELVYEGQDGYLAINYVELVPILIQSIQELKQQLDERTGLPGNDMKMARNATAIETTGTVSGNVLFQNKPNPFKEQTTICFRLADDATNAAICIFDMSGKMLKKLPVTQGMTSITVNGYELGEGLYLYSLIVNGREIDTKRMILSM